MSRKERLERLKSKTKIFEDAKRSTIFTQSDQNLGNSTSAPINHDTFFEKKLSICNHTNEAHSASNLLRDHISITSNNEKDDSIKPVIQNVDEIETPKKKYSIRDYLESKAGRPFTANIVHNEMKQTGDSMNPDTHNILLSLVSKFDELDGSIEF